MQILSRFIERKIHSLRRLISDNCNMVDLTDLVQQEARKELHEPWVDSDPRQKIFAAWCSAQDVETQERQLIAACASIAAQAAGEMDVPQLPVADCNLVMALDLHEHGVMINASQALRAQLGGLMRRLWSACRSLIPSHANARLQQLCMQAMALAADLAISGPQPEAPPA